MTYWVMIGIQRIHQYLQMFLLHNSMLHGRAMTHHCEHACTQDLHAMVRAMSPACRGRALMSRAHGLFMECHGFLQGVQDEFGIQVHEDVKGCAFLWDYIAA